MPRHWTPSFKDERAGLELSGSDSDLSDYTCMLATTRKVWFFREKMFAETYQHGINLDVRNPTMKMV